MVVCNFWLQNRCRYGSACKFEHPPGGASGGTSNAPPNPQKSQNPPQNRFSGFHGRHGGGHAPRRNGGAGDREDMVHPFHMSTIAIQQDLLEQPPQWILSAYGPGINAPSQLFGGAREMSPEEMRVGHYLAVAAGRGPEAAAQANSMYDDALNQMRRVGSDAQGAIDYVLDMASTHPNRVDVCAQRTTMRAPGAPIRPPFEVQPPKAFMGSNPPPAQAAPTSAPPAAPAQNTVARGTRFPPGVGLTTQIAFAGQQARQVAPYGPAAPAAQPAVAPRNPFGAPTAPAQANPFAAAAAANPFTSATRLSVPTQPSVAAPANPFVSAAQTAQARNAAPTPANPFAATAQPVQPPNAARPTSTNPPAASGRAITMNNPYPPDSTFRHPDINEYSTRDANNRLLTWKGKPVTYVDGKPCFKHDGSSGAWVRIWNPDGPPPYNKNTEMPLAMYDERTKEAYIYLRDHGRFKDGWIPMLPPRREWSRWDF